MRARRYGLLLRLTVTMGLVAVAAPSASAHSNGVFDPEARAVLIESAAQEASVIVCATVDSIERAHVYLTISQSLKGPLQHGDTLCIPSEPPSVDRGQSLVLFLCPRPGVPYLHVVPGLVPYLVGDSVYIAESWPAIGSAPAFLAQLHDLVDSQTPASLGRAADLIVEGTVAEADITGRYGSFIIDVAKRAGCGILPDAGTQIMVTMPGPASWADRFRLRQNPQVAAGDDAVFFLRVSSGGAYGLHGGLYSIWKRSGAVFAARAAVWVPRELAIADTGGMRTALDLH